MHHDVVQKIITNSEYRNYISEKDQLIAAGHIVQPYLQVALMCTPT